MLRSTGELGIHETSANLGHWHSPIRILSINEIRSCFCYFSLFINILQTLKPNNIIILLSNRSTKCFHEILSIFTFHKRGCHGLSPSLYPERYSIEPNKWYSLYISLLSKNIRIKRSTDISKLLMKYAINSFFILQFYETKSSHLGIFIIYIMFMFSYYISMFVRYTLFALCICTRQRILYSYENIKVNIFLDELCYIYLIFPFGYIRYICLMRK